MNKVFGQLGEDAAADCLIKRGYVIVSRNYRTRFGEIDIIARDKRDWVFVEVKARTSTCYGSAKEAVGFKKLAKLKLIIQDYVACHNITDPVRLEVVACQGDNPIEVVTGIYFSDLT